MMKKGLKSLILCLLCVCLLCFTACGKKDEKSPEQKKTLPADITASKITETIKSAVSGAPETNVFYGQNGKELDACEMSLWADGTFEECPEFELIDDYALFYSGDNTTYEISVLKAKKSEDVEKITKLFERRKNTLSIGDKAAYDPNFEKVMDDAVILTEGNFVILLITPDNDAAQKAINNLKQ